MTSELKQVIDSNKIYYMTEENLYKYIQQICHNMGVNNLNIDRIVKNVYPKLKRVNTLTEIEDQIVMTTSEMIVDHYDYSGIAVWILITRLHNNTHSDYSKVVEELRNNVNKQGKKAPIISEEFAEYVMKYKNEINAALHYERDFNISFFGFRTLERAYLKKLSNGKIVERPQHLFMRVAIALHFRNNDLKKIIETYNLLSEGYYIHATPTLFNAGTLREQLSSCFLLGLDDDMEAIGECWKNCAIISKYAGGIGIHMSNIRVSGAYIHSTQGTANGLRVIKIFNEIARYSDQGGKRAGSFAIFLEPWHGDIFFFLDLKKNTGAETDRARDIFLGLMVNDIFMRRVENDEIWSLMCPSECPELLNKYGEEFNNVYEKYENEGRYLKQINARDLWFKIMESQIESGIPYIIYKDATNYKSNQKNIGVINGSNLCVSGDTRILTSFGYYKIRDLVDKSICVWNGEEFSKVTIRKTGTNQKLIKIRFSNGSFLKCTPYHNFYINVNGSIIKKSAKELNIGDQLIDVKYPIIDTKFKIFRYPYTHALFCVFGKYEKIRINYGYEDVYYPSDSMIFNYVRKKDLIPYDYRPLLLLPSEKRMLINYMDYLCYFYCNNKDHHGKISVELYRDIPKIYVVPINYSIDIKLKWFAGLLDGCGKIGEDNSYISVTSSKKEFLNNVKYMLQTMGCDSMITSSKRGEYALLINMNDIFILKAIGLTTYFVDLSNIKISKNVSNYKSFSVNVIKKCKLIKRENTYCFTEPKRNMGIFNGIIAGQCAEILEVSNSSEYAVCLTEDTEIITRSGIRKIIDCDGLDVLSYFNNDVELKKYQHYENAKLVHKGKRIVYEIETKNNKKIKATSDHLFLVFDCGCKCYNKNKYKWEKVKDIKIGDKLVVPKIIPLECYTLTLSFKSFDIEYLTAGWMLGNGWMTKSGWGVSFRVTDKHAQKIVIRQMDEWQEQADKLSNITGKIHLNMRLTNGVSIWESNEMNFKELLSSKFGFRECDDLSKRIDDKVKYNFSINQASFLSGYYSACGCTIFYKNRIFINIVSNNKELLHDIQMMLIPFGISSRVIVRKRKNIKRIFLSIFDYDCVNNFCKYINFRLCPEKMVELEKLIGIIKKPSEIDNSIKKNHYSKVLSVRKIGEENVYDLVLENSHQFIANGYVVHNCNLSSICLPKFVEFINKEPRFNYQKLFEITKVITRNLNNIIDINFYPVRQTEISNRKHRPIGIGVQGLADVFALFKIPFDSSIARDLNKKIFETIYFGALTESKNLAKKYGPYETFNGSPLSQGKFQFDLWGLPRSKLSGMWNWEELMEEIKKYGVRNSLVTTCMPTASTSQIMNNNEAIEPYTENIYTRSTLAGDFYVINRHLMRDLIELNLWDSDMIDYIKYYEGSIQKIDRIPSNIKEIYRTVWEIPQKSLIEMSADRAPFIDQTQSLNIFIAKPNFIKLNSCLFYGWKLGLKTGMYYLRSKSSSEANKFGIDIDKIKEIENNEKKNKMTKGNTENTYKTCSRIKGEVCEYCTS